MRGRQIQEKRAQPVFYSSFILYCFGKDILPGEISLFVQKKY
jgi:hypothetical protein